MSSKDNPSSSSALSTAVNDLIRAAAGGEAHNVADEDLDKYIANLILKEAEAKRKRYDQLGVRAYQTDRELSRSSLPKPNKRFLLNVVRATDSHNQAVLRTAEEQARKARRERRRQRHRDHHDERDEGREGPVRGRRRSENSLSPVSRSRSSSPRQKPSAHEKQPKDDDVSERITFRGRGKVKLGQSAMDKYFDKRYDPAKDIESDVEEYIWNDPDESRADSKKKHKKKKKEKNSSKKKKKKRKREEEENEEDEDEDHKSESGNDERPLKIRAWDIGKPW
ncbi:hypothetical protein EC973_009074 [Apophysomyces ossiformis]|uniref:Uncharacterized protein n=1 Tax=Apophysomyces ossiformis TaxID=679940 RepID=A0A8H7BSV8_9FUNG|nr:hypothetical protein EC973_009074 [Apophysomyces ossiformis]